MKKILLLFMTIVSVVSLSQSCNSSSNKIEGDKNYVTITRNISNDFQKILTTGPFDIQLVEGKVGSITVKGEKNVISNLITKVSKGVLVVKFKSVFKSIKSHAPIMLIIPFNTLNEIKLTGSGEILIDKTNKVNSFNCEISGSGSIVGGVDVNHLSVNVLGSADVEFTGKAENFECLVSGSGNINSKELEADDLKVNVLGSGEVYAKVNKSIDAKVSGSGNIYYTGSPDKVKLKSTGSGKIKKRN